MTMNQCSVICKNGKQCSRKTATTTCNLCTFHDNKNKPVDDDKNTDKNADICVAICSNGKKCVRKSCIGINYCGTHKHLLSLKEEGTSTDDVSKNISTCTHSIFVEDIDGIAYYMDSYGNVFKAEDILQQSLTPSIIAKYTRDQHDEYKLCFVH